MKRRYILAILAVAFAGMLPAQESAIRTAEKEWAAAVMKNDEAALQRILGDQLIYGHSTGVVETKAEYLGKLKGGSQKYDTIEHTDMTVRLYGNTAVSHSKVHMSGNTKGVPFDNTLIMLHVWARQGGRWLLVAHQTAKLP